VNNWIYENNSDNSARYLLGERGTNALICIGINPSTAIPSKLDATVTRVKKIAAMNGYDGWLMLNIYPQRDTYPTNIHLEGENKIITANRKAVLRVLAEANYKDIWAAWGTEISRRPFLYDCLKELVSCFEGKYNWINYGELTKTGHPRHPSRMSYTEGFKEFCIKDYIKKHV